MPASVALFAYSSPRVAGSAPAVSSSAIDAGVGELKNQAPSSRTEARNGADDACRFKRL
jgi:hypothetical protein